MKTVIIDSRNNRRDAHCRIFSLVNNVEVFYLDNGSIIERSIDKPLDNFLKTEFDLALVHVGDIIHSQSIKTKNTILYGGKGNYEDRLGSEHNKQFLFNRSVDETGGFITDGEAAKLVNWVLGNEKLEDLSFLFSESKIREKLLLLHFLLTEKNANASSIKDFLDKEKIAGLDEKSPEIERFLTSKDSYFIKLTNLRDTFLSELEKHR